MTQYTEKEIIIDDTRHYWCTCIKDCFFSYVDPDAKGELVFKKDEKYEFYFESDGNKVWVYFQTVGGLEFSIKPERYLDIFTDYFEYDKSQIVIQTSNIKHKIITKKGAEYKEIWYIIKSQYGYGKWSIIAKITQNDEYIFYKEFENDLLKFNRKEKLNNLNYNGNR